jgi:hypothetical protein
MSSLFYNSKCDRLIRFSCRSSFIILQKRGLENNRNRFCVRLGACHCDEFNRLKSWKPSTHFDVATDIGLGVWDYQLHLQHACLHLISQHSFSIGGGVDSSAVRLRRMNESCKITSPKWVSLIEKWNSDMLHWRIILNWFLLTMIRKQYTVTTNPCGDLIKF